MDKLQLARLKLSIQAAYLNRVLWSLQPVETPSVGTMGVDKGLRLYYNPEFLESVTLPETIALLVHEIHHVLRDHLLRAPRGEELAWNIATDAEINDDLVQEHYIWSKFVLPKNLGLPNNLTAEEYYKHIQANTTKVEFEVTLGAGNCGSIVTGKSDNHELSSNDKNYRGMTKLEQDLLRRAIAQDILEAAKNPGEVPGDLTRWAKAHLESQVDWRKELAVTLRRYLARARGLVDYTYQKPSTRRPTISNGTEFILPSTYAPVPDIAVVVDTSVSISAHTLGQALAEVEGILKKANAISGVHLIACDHKAYYVGRVLSAKVDDKLTGGGGTDMGLGIAMAENLHAEIGVILTDGHTPWPTERPKCRTIVCLIGTGHAHSDSVPDWARVVTVDI